MGAGANSKDTRLGGWGQGHTAEVPALEKTGPACLLKSLLETLPGACIRLKVRMASLPFNPHLPLPAEHVVKLSIAVSCKLLCTIPCGNIMASS